MELKFLSADAEGIESVGAIGAVFVQIFFGLGNLFSRLIFSDHEVARQHWSNTLQPLETPAD